MNSVLLRSARVPFSLRPTASTIFKRCFASSNNDKPKQSTPKQEEGAVLGSIWDIDYNAKYATPDPPGFFKRNERPNPGNTEQPRQRSNFYIVLALFGVNAVIFGLWHLDEYRRQIYKEFNIRIDGFDQQYMVENFTMRKDVLEDEKHRHTLLTHMFSQKEPFHFLSNMFVLLSMGSLARKAGAGRFLSIYLLCGLASAGAVIFNENYLKEELKRQHFQDKSLWYKFKNGYNDVDRDTYFLGASGSIYGLVSSAVFIVGLREAIFIVPLLAFDGYCLWNSMQKIKNNDKEPSLISQLLGVEMSNIAHIGGALCGFLLGIILRKRVI